MDNFIKKPDHPPAPKAEEFEEPAQMPEVYQDTNGNDLAAHPSSTRQPSPLPIDQATSLSKDPRPSTNGAGAEIPLPPSKQDQFPSSSRDNGHAGPKGSFSTKRYEADAPMKLGSQYVRFPREIGSRTTADRYISPDIENDRRRDRKDSHFEYPDTRRKGDIRRSSTIFDVSELKTSTPQDYRSQRREDTYREKSWEGASNIFGATSSPEGARARRQYEPDTRSAARIPIGNEISRYLDRPTYQLPTKMENGQFSIPYKLIHQPQGANTSVLSGAMREVPSGTFYVFLLIAHCNSQKCLSEMKILRVQCNHISMDDGDVFTALKNEYLGLRRWLFYLLKGIETIQLARCKRNTIRAPDGKFMGFEQPSFELMPSSPERANLDESTSVFQNPTNGRNSKSLILWLSSFEGSLPVEKTSPSEDARSPVYTKYYETPLSKIEQCQGLLLIECWMARRVVVFSVLVAMVSATILSAWIVFNDVELRFTIRRAIFAVEVVAS